MATLTNSTPVNSSKTIDVTICGAHLTDQPLNWQLTERGVALKAKTETATCYRMCALAGGPPLRQGLVLDNDALNGQKGTAIEVEVWDVPTENFGSLIASMPAFLGTGKVTLADGSKVSGFIYEPCAIEGAE
ncbi:hypothetical protein OAH87_03880 [Marinomonas sp.]|nr:hypothetical protein [Marinomonas sp.]MDB4837588.1 hypothetical protein [Marinomonas sp.]